MLQRMFGANKDLLLVLGTVLILIILFSPIPAVILDLAIIVNFGFALTILLLTFYVKKPVEFSTFPSLLLIATLFRLSLNVASTRLILSDAEAGQVIGSIGSYAVSGNFIVGLVVFSILIVVQFVVVTSGAQRVSEVAARFTLDSMPGQQMSIDADLNMGLIDQNEAKRRRLELEKEAAFYGSMDGASKFVKGDAIAGIIIILINIIAGWIIGVVQMGMDWSTALQTFSLLTVGDGIATQLPALIIAVATGIIVTRSAADSELSAEVFRQLSSEPRIPVIVGILLLIFLFMPGMPKWPIFIMVAITGWVWWRSRRKGNDDQALTDGSAEDEKAQVSRLFPVLEIALGEDLGAAWQSERAIILDRIEQLRQSQQDELGLAFPPLALIEGPRLDSNAYEIRLFGTRYGRGEIYAGSSLAVEGPKISQKVTGIETRDPAFGLPAVWIEAQLAEKAEKSGYTIIDPVSVLITHLSEIVRGEAPLLLTRASVVSMLEEVRERQGGLIEELIPSLLTVSDIQRVLQNLLSEAVSIANIDLIIEHLVDLARQSKDTVVLTEKIRERLSYTICNKLQDRHSDLAVLSFDPRVEGKLKASLNGQSEPQNIIVEPKLAGHIIQHLINAANKMQGEGRRPVLLCGPEIRRQLRAFTKRSLPRLAIISVNEVPTHIELRSFDTIPWPSQVAESNPA